VASESRGIWQMAGDLPPYRPAVVDHNPKRVFAGQLARALGAVPPPKVLRLQEDEYQWTDDGSGAGE
jgi:hypothetical protein